LTVYSLSLPELVGFPVLAHIYSAEKRLPQLLTRIWRDTVPSNAIKPTIFRTARTSALALPGDATASNWQQRRRCFGGYDVEATEAV
jgi:hypothetical protein